MDPAEGFVGYARDHVRDERAVFQIADAMALPFEDETFDAVVSGLALNFVPRPDAALAGMTRVARPGGTIAAYVWDYAGRMDMMRAFWDAAVALDKTAAERDEGLRFPICSPDPLESLFRNSGLQAVEVRAIDATTRFRDFDDYWTPFLGGQGPAPGYVASLTEPQRTALRDLLRSRLPVAPDNSISLTARAWSVRGTKRWV